MTAPLFARTTPPGATYTSGVSPLFVSGTVSAVDYPVASVNWWNSATQQGGTASFGGGTWYANIPLAVGANQLIFWSTNTNNESSPAPDLQATYIPGGLPKVLYNSQSYVWTFTQQGNVQPTAWHFKWGTSPGNYTHTQVFASSVFSAPLNTVLPGVGNYYAVICAFDGSVEWAVSPEFACEVVLSLYNPPTGVLTLTAQ